MHFNNITHLAHWFRGIILAFCLRDVEFKSWMSHENQFWGVEEKNSIEKVYGLENRYSFLLVKSPILFTDYMEFFATIVT